MPDKLENLMALHDGEASPEQSPGEGGADDSQSQELLARLAAADRAFAQAADELLDMPVPSKLVDAIRNPTSPESEAPKTAEIIPFPKRRRAIVSFAIAAGLAAVVVTNTELFQAPAGPELKFQTAQHEDLFQDVMNSLASGDLRASDDNGLSLMPMVSFRTQEDAYCREFMALQGGEEYSAVACYGSAGQWELKSQNRVTSGTNTSAYRAASGDEAQSTLPPELVKAADLSYAEEQQAIRSGWADSQR